MKTKTKALVLALCAVLLVVTTVFVTLAYLTATTATVKNTFTVGNVILDDEKDLTDGLNEAKVDIYGKPVGEDGKPVDKVEAAPRVTANEYKLIPGHTYVKDPTLTVGKNSEEAYVRMIVTITDLKDIKAAFGADFLPQNFVNGTWDSSIWKSHSYVVSADGDTATCEFWYYKTVNTLDGKNLELEPLFKEIKVPANVSNEALLALKEMKIDVVAHAIQADGFANPEAAWAAFGK